MATDKKSGLRTRVGHAGFWLAIRQLSVRSLAIVQLLLLVRILSPAEFGLFAVAIMVYAFIEAMTFMGFGQALIQRKTIDSIHLNTLFVVNIARGALLGLLVFALSGPVAWLMKSPESQPLIAAIGLLPLIVGIHNPAMILLQKELRMKQELAFHLVGALTNLAISLALALQEYGAWSLIAGVLAQAICQLFISYLTISYFPRIQFCKISFFEMYNFGKWLMASQGLKYFSNNLPAWVIGHYLGMQALGLYNIASRFSQSIGNEFSAMVSTVAFPVFSIIQDDRRRLVDAYLHSQRIVMSASFLVFGCLIVLSEKFVIVFLGQNWHGAENSIALLALLGMIQSIGAQADIMKALNETRIVAVFSFIRLVFVATIIIPFTKEWGVNGAVAAILIPTVVLLIPAMAIILRRLDVAPYRFIRQSIPPIVSLVLIILIPHEIYYTDFSDLFQFFAILIGSFAIYT